MRDKQTRSPLNPVPLLRSFDWRLRVATSPWRVLPNFVILGAQRGGTTSLFDYLARHPQVVPAYRKEVHFHDLHYSRGVGWYRAHFPLARQMSEGDITGEATPNYLVHPDAPRRLNAVTPDARLIVMLRDPTERAHSAWRLRSSEGRETETFEEAVTREQQNPDPVITDYHEDPKGVGDAIRFLYLAKSRYAEQFERWLEFFPVEQFLVITSEDLFGQPNLILSELSKFLEIDLWEPDSFPVLNQIPTGSIDPGLRRELSEYFRPHNDRLESLLGRQFNWR
jgi:hypothetical protein